MENKIILLRDKIKTEISNSINKVFIDKWVSKLKVIDDYIRRNNLNYSIKEVHISQIIPGDTILHVDGLLRTVCKSNIKKGGFCGKTLFGDPYRSGTILVKKITFHTLN